MWASKRVRKLWNSCLCAVGWIDSVYSVTISWSHGSKPFLSCMKNDKTNNVSIPTARLIIINHFSCMNGDTTFKHYMYVHIYISPCMNGCIIYSYNPPPPRGVWMLSPSRWKLLEDRSLVYQLIHTCFRPNTNLTGPSKHLEFVIKVLLKLRRKTWRNNIFFCLFFLLYLCYFLLLFSQSLLL